MVAIARRGVDVTSSTAGGSACDDPGLVPNAMHLRAVVPSDPGGAGHLDLQLPRAVMGHEPGPGRCLPEGVPDHKPGGHRDAVDIPTFRAFGADWSTELADAVEAGLTEASEAGRVQ